ncbi:hypothetical protein [Mesorhizobium sp. B2-1-3]|nr:hypothetical protein [Mesorhizobium sp. B2-1-3]
MSETSNRLAIAATSPLSTEILKTVAIGLLWLYVIMRVLPA